MIRPWLLLDCNCLCHRAFHTFKNLSQDEIPTGLYFGFFRDITYLQRTLNTSNVAFFWDHGKSIRLERLSTYKESRQKKRDEMSPRDYKAYQVFYRQMNRIRQRILPDLGFNNVFSQHNYEADDLIANAVKENEIDAIIVSSDEDLFQLLDERTAIYNPHKQRTITEQMFIEKYDILPKHWAHVKAIAGCRSDDIPGVDGVGEKKAIAYIRNELPKHYAAYDNIVAESELIRSNMALTRLPYKGTMQIEFADDKLNAKAWKKFRESTGIDLPFPSIKRVRRNG